MYGLSMPQYSGGGRLLQTAAWTLPAAGHTMDGAMTWIEEALDELQAGRRPDGAWSYHALPAVGDPSVEATALAAMAMAAHGRDAAPAFDWLVAAQRTDGGFASSPAVNETNWVTAIAAVALLRAGRTTAGEAAVNALLSIPAYVYPPTWNSPYGYDTSLKAWPWAPGDFTWVEPTAMAMLALRQSSQAGHARVAQGRRVLLDRVGTDPSQGGWNYGEPRVLGVNLPSATVPTALAVLALRGMDADLTAPIAFLQGRREATSSLFSLGWAANAIASVGVLDEAWRAALADVWTAGGSGSPTRAAARRGMGTALALLAVAERTANPLIVG